MGLKKSKKPAMVLVLILMIITSLSILIIGALKVLTSTDMEYSANRNSSSASVNKRISGKYICYKKLINNVYKLYQQQVEYNIDGSIKSKSEETAMANNNCIFTIPSGVRNFEITAIGAGGAGAASTRKYEYEEVSTNDCILNNIKKVLKSVDGEIYCSNQFTSYSNICSGTYKYQEDESDTKFAPFLQKISLRRYSTSNCYNSPVWTCTYYNGKKQCHYTYSSTRSYHCTTSYSVACNKASGALVYPSASGELCKLSYKKGGSNHELVINKSIYGKTQREIEEDILAKLAQENNIASCVQENPKYSIWVGSPGMPGEVQTVNTNNMIYGSNKGEDKITINASNIGDGGTKSQNAGTTTFKYWYKSSKGYKEAKVSANGGNQGTSTQHSITSSDQAENIDSKEGVMPGSIELPSAFNFGNLSAGYYAKKDPKNATYFGSSGASGYIDDLEMSNLTSACQKVKINGTLTSAGCGVSNPTNSVKGTDGAPGAIIISW